MLERWYPSAGAVLVVVASFLWLPVDTANSIKRELLADATSIGAIIVGFLAAAQAVLATISTSSKFLERLKQADGYIPLVSYFTEGISSGLVLVIVSGVFRVSQSSGWWAEWGAPVWLGIASWTMMSMYRIIRIYAKILKRI